MALETSLSESAMNKSVDEKMEEALVEKTMDEEDVLKVAGDSPVLDSKDEEKLKEAEIPESKENEDPKEQTLVNEGLNDEKVADEADVSKTVDDPPVLDFKDTENIKEEKTPAVQENEIPNEQATVDEGINVEKAQDEAELSRPGDRSSISDSKDQDILKEEERIEVKEIETPEEQQIVESATNETLEIPKTPEVEETNPPKDEETEIPMKEDFMNAQESNIPKEVETNNGATEGSSNEEEIPVMPGNNPAKKQDILEATEKENLEEDKIPDLAEEEKSCEQINKDQALTEKGSEEPSKVVEEDKLQSEAFESAEGDREKEATVAESQEVQIPVGTGIESKTEIPAAAVIKDAAKGNEEPSKVVEEDKLQSEAFESAEGDREKEATVAESQEVQIPVETRTESKTEIPAAVVTNDATKGNEEPSKVVEEDKLKSEAFESSGGDREKEATVAESQEVQIPVETGAESKTEIPTAVITKDATKPTARRSTDIFRHVGSKMMQMVQKMRNAITRKSSNGKVAK